MRHLLLILLAIVCLAPAAWSYDQPLSAPLQEGVDAYHQGRVDESLTLIRGYAIRNPTAADLPVAYLYLTRLFLQAGDFTSARLYLDRLPQAERDSSARLLAGELLLHEEQPVEALQTLRSIDSTLLQGEDKARYHLLLAQGFQRTEQPLAALATLQLGLELLPPSNRIALLEKAHQIATELSTAELDEASFMFTATAIGQDLLLQQARLAFAAGEKDQALAMVQQVIAEPVSFPYREEAALLLDRLSGRPWLQRAIGVLLPESGRYAGFGELVRRGIDLAGQLHDQERVPVRFVFRDTGGDAATTATAVHQLANEERVMAILGPISGVAGEAAAYQAESEGVPLLTLSQRQGLPQIGPQVFRASLTKRNQARELVRYAVDQLGYSSFGVLYPETRFGQEFYQLFDEAARERNAMVTAAEGYPATATDFRTQIRRLMGEDPDHPEDPRDWPEKEQIEDLFVPEFPPVDFDALFIPDFADRVALIAPQLPFYGMEGVPLLGINGWNSPDLVRNAGRAINGAVFVDGFFRYSSHPFVRDFVDLFFTTYGEEPSILEAQGFDAANILLSLLDQAWVTDRQQLGAALQRFRNYPGVTGATSFDAEGDAEKVLFLLQVQHGNIEQIN